jgi:hypothetical protein
LGSGWEGADGDEGEGREERKKERKRGRETVFWNEADKLLGSHVRGVVSFSIGSLGLAVSTMKGG